MEGSHADDFDGLYDEATLARLRGRPVGSARPSRSTVGAGRERLAAGALVMALGAGLAEAFDPEPRRPRIVELDPGVDDDEPLPVTVHLVPGDARASVIVVRPWLLAS